MDKSVKQSPFPSPMTLIFCGPGNYQRLPDESPVKQNKHPYNKEKNELSGICPRTNDIVQGTNDFYRGQMTLFKGQTIFIGKK